jgi:hypothetical protein
MRPIEKMLVAYGIIKTSNKILCNVYPLNILYFWQTYDGMLVC